MSTEAYIEMVYKNLKGELSPEEFIRLNEVTVRNSELASLRIEIEDAWDISGAEEELVEKGDTEKLFQRIVENKAKITSIFSLRNILTGVAAMFILGLSSVWLMRDQTKIYTKEGLIRLADNSTIDLRKGSRLEVSSFNADMRNVRLVGEAFFDIEKDSNRPFIISAADTKIEVLGTSFLVKGVNESVYVVVEEGRVEFSSNTTSESLELTKGMKAEFNKNTGLNEIQYQNLSGWKSGVYQFQDQSLADILKELGIIFNSTIEVEQQQLLNCRISAILTAENLEEVIKQLAKQLEMNAKQDGQIWLLSGGRCK